MILDKIPHLAQVGPNADRSRNDCGPACVAMCVSGLVRPLTVDQSSLDCGQVRHSNTGFSHLMRGLGAHGLSTVLHNQFQPDGRLYATDIRAEIGKGNPVILLVHYDGLPYPKQDTRFHGWHFVTAVGFTDDEIVINDPLFWGNRQREGRHIHVADTDIERAMSFNQRNYPHQGLVVIAPEAPEPEPVDDEPNWEAVARAAQAALDDIQVVLNRFTDHMVI